ncbi:hypothetical protein Tsubulata_042180 [Turnera subulata]|uniref:C2 domain-containing protein n=1 Tax=Turnera subulata TaxID=218843 RepID=A0A9Q0GAL2_9ROSI|nr:hypothetical protein Tsubulata_042180 [Turnera subulata]
MCKGISKMSWNYSMRFYIEDWMLQQNHLRIVFQIRQNQIFGRGHKVVGEVSIPVKALFDNCWDDKEIQHGTYQVMTSSKKPRGSLFFSYNFGEKVKRRPQSSSTSAFGLWHQQKSSQSSSSDSEYQYKSIQYHDEWRPIPSAPYYEEDSSDSEHQYKSIQYHDEWRPIPSAPYYEED